MNGKIYVSDPITTHDTPINVKNTKRRAGFHNPCGFVTDSGADKRPLPSNAPLKQAATLEQKRSLQAL